MTGGTQPSASLSSSFVLLPSLPLLLLLLSPLQQRNTPVVFVLRMVSLQALLFLRSLPEWTYTLKKEYVLLQFSALDGAIEEVGCFQRSTKKAEEATQKTKDQQGERTSCREKEQLEKIHKRGRNRKEEEDTPERKAERKRKETRRRDPTRFSLHVAEKKEVR